MVPIRYNLRNLFERKATTLMTAFGIALTVAVMVIAMALVDGLKATFSATGDPLNLVVMRKGATAELNSSVAAVAAAQLKTLSGIRKDNGQPMVSPELISVINLPSVDNPSGMNLTVRGLLPIGVSMRNLKIVTGRWSNAGQREVTVGSSVAKRYAAAQIGNKLRFGRGEWLVVGVFDGGKSAVNSEIWCNLNQLQADFDRQGNSSSVLVRSESFAEMDGLAKSISNDRTISSDATKEQEYYASMTSSGLPLQILGTFVASIMAIGSGFGAMNTMYAAVARRSREIGTLRSLGFSRRSILSSFMFESISLSLLGGILGCLLALPMNWVTTGVGNFNTFSEIAFNFRVGSRAIVIGLMFATFIGAVGGFLPALAAARRDLLTTLREA